MDTILPCMAQSQPPGVLVRALPCYGKVGRPTQIHVFVHCGRVGTAKFTYSPQVMQLHMSVRL